MERQGKKIKKSKGFTLVEVVITIAVVAILSAILVPMISKNIESARNTRAKSDVLTIGKAIVQYHKDMAAWPVYRGSTAAQLLFSDKDIDNNGVPDTSNIPATWNSISTGNRLSLYYNLINNTNNYTRGPSVSGSPTWNGPYLSDISPDPWGNAYLVNAQWLSDIDKRSVYVLSAGPGRPASVETPFNGNPPADSDDIVFRIQ